MPRELADRARGFMWRAILVLPRMRYGTVRPTMRSEEGSGRRLALIRLARTFVPDIAQVHGVTRVALIGSLTTTKQDPKDIDLLITVEPIADLAPLACHARRLMGAAQSLGKGADVFLADPDGNYLGRVCQWKVCRAGVRLRCDALHCGQRPHLHDDLEAVRLPVALIRSPPVILWPEARCNEPAPADLEQGLLRSLPVAFTVRL